MLGLLRGHHGRDTSPLKPGQREPVVTEILSPVSEKSNTHDDLTPSKGVDVQQQPAFLSPTLSQASSLHISKRQPSYPRALGSVRTSSGRFRNTFVREQHSIVLQQCRREYGKGVGDRFFDMSFDGLLQWINSERLMRLPHKGGSWDRVLIGAQYFAEQVHQFNQHIEHFTEESGAATHFVYGQCLLLLEIGHENASALEKAFNLFYQFGLELSPLLRRADLFTGSQVIMKNLGRAFTDLLQIVTGVSISFYQAMHSEREFTKLDLFASFSSIIEVFRVRIHRCSHEMWNVALAGNATDGYEIDGIQRWLSPKDSVLAFLSSNHINLACQPEQFTCTWFQPHLNSFLKSDKKILLVEGKAGSGKTTLANWTVDRLQRPIGRKHLSTIGFFFDHSIPAQSTPLAMLRTLLNQLLTVCIGNTSLYGAAYEAFVESAKVRSAEESEDKMWRALSMALHAVSHAHDGALAIVVDGITATDSSMQQTRKKLHDLVRECRDVQLIQFSQSLDNEVASSMHVKLSTENMLDDLRTVVRRKLHDHEHFKNRELGDQDNIIEQIVATADGSMLWAYLTCKLLKRQHSFKGFDETLKSVMTGSKSIPEITKMLFISLDLGDECKELLSLLVTTERPLQLREIEALLLTDTKQHTMADKTVRLQHLSSHLSAFTIIGEGLVSIRHDALRQAIIGLGVDAPFAQHLKQRHQDMLERLLICTKSSLRAEHEPTFSCFGIVQMEQRLGSHTLLEYAIRYWALHFKKSLLFKSKGEFQLPKEFKKIFSESVTFCLLEQACWDAQSFPQDAFELHHLAFRIRKALFGQNHACVLQSAMFCAVLCEKALSRHSEANEWYALVAQISSIVVGVQADLTITCCDIFLRISEAFIKKERTVVMTNREGVLFILVRAYKHRFGSSSKEVLEIYQRLEEFYLYIGEDTKQAEIVAIIEKLTVAIYGGLSDEAQLISRKAQVLLKRHEHVEEINTRDGLLFFGYREEMEEEFTLEIVAKLFHLAKSCIIRKDFARAEGIYIELWLKLTHHCKSVDSCLWHEKKIEVMLVYAHFLEDHKRHSEASAILVAIWTEYEHHELSMFESIIFMLKDVAVFMKSIKLFTMALLAFQKCLSYFNHRHEKHTLICTEIEKHILEISKTTTVVTEKSSDTVISSAFEMTIASSETITATTVNLCTSLALIHINQQRWSEAITCIKKLLVRSWSTFFAESVESILLAEQFSSESVTLVKHLAECYVGMKKYERAEEIYIRLYRAHHRHCKIDEAKVIEYRELLLKFYDRHELYVKTISFYQELLVEYRSHYGLSHALTIQTLYKLGALCRLHSSNYGYWLEYYLEIVVNLNKGQLLCHHDAFDALLIVAEHYYETLRFSESLVYFRSIFKTFRVHGCRFHKFFEIADKVEILLRHYLRAIEECSLDIHIQVKILRNLKTACCQFYGESSSISIVITKTLAETCYRHEQYQSEAMSLWEFVLNHKTTMSKAETMRIEFSLKTLYVKKASTTVVSHEELKKFTKITHKLYLEIREEHSCTADKTLTCLRELVMLYCKQSKVEIELAKKELKGILIHCLTKVTVAKELIEAATTLAAIYVSCGFTEEGFELVRHFKFQVIYQPTESWKLGRSCFAFIAAFEYHLHATYESSLNLYLAELMAEYAFYQRLMQHIQNKVELKMVFECGAWLHQILLRTERIEHFSFIKQKVLDYFISKETTVVKACSKMSIQIFVSVLLRYSSKHIVSKNFVAAAGYAAVGHLEELLGEHKHNEALELATCTFRYLMAHEGLDDPAEIKLGFRLCLLMAGRTHDKTLNHKCSDSATAKSMMNLSHQILAEVLDICKNPNYFRKMDLASYNLFEFNEVIILLGEQQDFNRLQWLLELLWSSREAQSSWSTETMLRLGERLVQAQFAVGNTSAAVRLCENTVYNVRRVHGLRHHYTVKFHALLASMYTSLAVTYSNEAQVEGNKNKKHAQYMARMYFKKAVQVHEEVLKQIVNADDADNSDCEDDESDYSDTGSVRRFSGGVNGNANAGAICGFAWMTQEQEVESVMAHIRRLQLAIQRLGGWAKDFSEYEKLTARVWGCYGKNPAFKMGEHQVLANKWKTDGFGMGKAEGDLKEDGFKLPEVWWIGE